MKKLYSFGLIALLSVLISTSSAYAAGPATVNLGTAGSFAILAGTTITNTGSTTINGDLGLSPGTSVTGFPPGTVNGTQHITDTTASKAETDLATAYADASSRTATSTISGDIGGQTFSSGVYRSSSSLGITGNVTLNAQNDPNAVFIFQVNSALTTASSSNVILSNGAQACNVFWQIGSSATLGTSSTLKGNVLALTSATLNTNAGVEGRVLARNGAVTLDTNTITLPACTSPTASPATPTSTPAGTSSSGTTSDSTTADSATKNKTPKLPNTGVNPASENTSSKTILLVGIGVYLFMIFIARSKRIG